MTKPPSSRLFGNISGALNESTSETSSFIEEIPEPTDIELIEDTTSTIENVKSHYNLKSNPSSLTLESSESKGHMFDNLKSTIGKSKKNKRTSSIEDISEPRDNELIEDTKLTIETPHKDEEIGLNSFYCTYYI